MFLDILKFELNFHRKQHLIYILSGVFFLLFFLATASSSIRIGSGVGNVNLNSPFAILNSLSAISVFAMFGAVAFSANSVVRDFELKTAELFFSRPIPKLDYVYGRFFGSLFFSYVLFFAGLLGVLVGEFMPWLDQERIGSFSASAYLYGFWVFGLPNIFIVSSIFFCVATVSRSMMATYVSAVLMMMITLVLGTFTEKDTIQMTSIADPFGSIPFGEVTRYWTVFEKNSSLPAVEGSLLVNRVIWVGIGIFFLALAYPLFPFSMERARKAKKDKKFEETSEATIFQVTRVITTQNFNFATHLQQCLSQTRLEVLNIVRSAPFIILLLFGLLQVVFASLGNLGNIAGTSVYPSTFALVRVINGAFSLSIILVLIYYSGELMARERAVKVSEIMDAMPFPNWIMITAKLSGLITVMVCMMLAAMLAAIGVQLSKDFYDIDLWLYLQGLLFFFQLPVYLMIVLSIFFYVVSRSKYIAMFMMVAYLIVNQALPALGFEHYLYRMSATRPIYSDFTGYGHNLTPYLWQSLYMALFAGLLLVVVHLMWPRGTEDDWTNRLKVVRQRMSQPVVVSIWALSTAFVLVGGFIFYNTTILNPYLTGKDIEKIQANYEKKFKQYQFKETLTTQRVYAEVDFFPSRQEVSLLGYYLMTNASDQPVSELHFSLPLGPTIKSLDVPGASLTLDDEYGYRIYSFDQPVQPGDTIKVSFNVDWLTPGFANSGHSPKLAENGSFVNNFDFFPQLGYNAQGELQDNNIRREHDLEPLQRIAKIDDQSAWNRNGLSGPRIDFETIVSTDVDKIAVAPGYLQKQWVDGDRQYFHYKMDAPIWGFYSFMSADYEVRRDSWQDVAIEVYYKHEFNVDTMILSAKNSLKYFSENFTPYQYRQFRILEFPNYQGRFAQSFPNTVPFAEHIGFTADLRDKKEIDYVYYVTAHELAHQWWAHQVLGADVQGSSMIVETLAQYSALMAMEKQYGKDQMKRFLGFELDAYLRGRGGELINEMPLFLVENQPYIHYRKGSLVLYALRDYVGEQIVNDSLHDFLDQYAFQGPPYPTTKDLLSIIRQKAGPQHEMLIVDLFEKIVLFDLKVSESRVVELETGQFEVTIDLIARKFEANGTGEEVEVPIANWIDIGILGAEQGEAAIPEVIYLQKHEFNQSELKVTIVVDKKPVSVGIDPMNKLIDRNPDDNITDV